MSEPQRKKNEIAKQIYKSCTIFAIFGLATICLGILLNAILLGFNAFYPPIPKVTKLVVTGIDSGPINIMAEMQFPGRMFAGLINVQTQGETTVALKVNTVKKPDVDQSLLSVTIPDGLNINLASSKASTVAFDNIQLNLHDLSPALVSEIIDFDAGKVTMPKNVKIELYTRVRTNSLLIPFGMDLKIPLKFDLDKAASASGPTKSKSETLPQPSEATKDSEDKLSPAMQKILSDFVSKRFEIRSYDESFAIQIEQSIPLSVFPDFLSVDVPEMRWSLAYNPSENNGAEDRKLISVELKPFAISKVESSTDPDPRVQIKIAIIISNDHTNNISQLAQMFLESKENDVKFVVGVDRNFASLQKPGSLMYWMRNLQIRADLKQLSNFSKKSAEAKDNSEGKKQTDKPSSSIKIEDSAPKTQLQRDIDIIYRAILKNIKIKIVKLSLTEDGKGSTLNIRIRMLRKRILTALGLSNRVFYGNFPGLGFQISKISTGEKEFTRLLKVLFEAKTVESRHKRIDFSLLLTLNHFLKEIPAYVASKTGDKNVGNPAVEWARDAFLSLKTIERLHLKFDDQGIFSRIASFGNCYIHLDENLKPSKISFETSKREISLESSQSVQNTLSAAKTFMMNRIKTDIVVKNKQNEANEPTAVTLGAKIKIQERPNYSPKQILLSWGDFYLDLVRDDRAVVSFAVQQGYVVIGFDGSVVPVVGSVNLQLTIPTKNDDVKSLQTLVGQFLPNVKVPDNSNLGIAVRFGTAGSQYKHSLPVALLKAIKEGKYKLSQVVGENFLPSTDKKSGNKAAKVAKEEPAKNLFADLANSVFQLVSFQAPTVFLHINIPTTKYCDASKRANYDVKINANIAVPVLQVNLCAKLPEEQAFNCFLRAGTSRPVIFSTEIIDGQVCFLESKVLPAEEVILGSQEIISITAYQFQSNEFPIHVSLSNVANLVRFGRLNSEKKKQILSLGAWDDSTAIQKLIGRLGSTLLNIEVPLQKPEKVETKQVNLPSDPPKLNIRQTDDSASVSVTLKSLTRRKIQLYASLALPSYVLQGISTALDPLNLYKWPVLRWSVLEYQFGIPDAFTATLKVTPGELDIKPDGPVLALNPVAVTVSLDVDIDERVDFGATGMRQIFSELKKYIEMEPKQRAGAFEPEFFTYIREQRLKYYIKTSGTHGLQDTNVFAADGGFYLIDIFNTLDAVRKVEGESLIIKLLKVNPFKDLKIGLTSAPSAEVIGPKFDLPCLVPSLCQDNKQTTVVSNGQDAINLYLEISNFLLPLTEMLGVGFGMMLSSLKFSHLPSHYQLNVNAETEIRTAFMVNGAGVAEIGLHPFKFSRKAKITYPGMEFNPNERTEEEKQQVDHLVLKIDFGFAPTISKLSPSLSFVRASDLNLPVVVPPLYYKRENHKLTRVKLVNPDIQIAFGNDRLLADGKSSLLATLISAILQEISVPGIKPNELLNEDKPTDKTNQPERKLVKILTPSSQLLGSLAIFGAQAIGFSVPTASIDVQLQVDIPFDSPILSINLAKKIQVRLYYKDMPFLQVLIEPADANAQRILIAKSQEGYVPLRVSVSINFSGVDGERPIDENTRTELWRHAFDKNREFSSDRKLLPITIKAQLGDEATLTAALAYPIYNLLYWIRSKQPDRVPTSSGSLEANYFHPSSISIYPGATALKPALRECIDGKAVTVPVERKYRLETVTLQNTAIFYEEGKATILPKEDVNVYFQLRNHEHLPVCGLPKKIEQIKLVLTRENAHQPDVQLIKMFNCMLPQAEEVLQFDTQFIPEFSIFKATINLPYAGIYKVQFKYGYNFANEENIDDLAIYANQIKIDLPKK